MYFSHTDLLPNITYNNNSVITPSIFSTRLDSNIKGPLLWDLEVFENGIMFRFNHAVSDQGSFMRGVAPFFCEEGGGEIIKWKVRDY